MWFFPLGPVAFTQIESPADPDAKNTKNKKPKRLHTTTAKQHEAKHDPAKPIEHNWLHIYDGTSMPSGDACIKIDPNGSW